MTVINETAQQLIEISRRQAAQKARRRKRGWTIEATIWACLALLYLVFAGPYLLSQADWSSVFIGFATIPLLLCWGASIFHRLPPDL